MSGLLKNMCSSVAKSGNFAIFVVRTGCRLTEYSQDIFFTADKAALLRRFYFGSLDRFAKLQERVALFVFIHNQIFSRMRTGRNLADSVNNSTRTASKPVQAKPIKRYYQVHFRAQRINLGVSNLECSHPFLATSREEAVGMAIDYLVGKWPHYNLLAETITCYPLNLKSAAL